MAYWPPAGGPEARPPGPSQQGNFRGVAQVRHSRRPHLGDTDDLPVIERPTPTLHDTRGNGPPGYPAPRGMVVRRRGRRLRAGAGWTWTGLTILLTCWGIWAISVRGTELLGPVLGLVLVLGVGVLMFVLARLIGRGVLERALGRERPSAWPSHLTVCVFFTLVGITFLQQTWWVVQGWQAMGDSWQWLVDLWPG